MKHYPETNGYAEAVASGRPYTPIKISHIDVRIPVYYDVKSAYYEGSHDAFWISSNELTGDYKTQEKNATVQGMAWLFCPMAWDVYLIVQNVIEQIAAQHDQQPIPVKDFYRMARPRVIDACQPWEIFAAKKHLARVLRRAKTKHINQSSAQEGEPWLVSM